MWGVARVGGVAQVRSTAPPVVVPSPPRAFLLATGGSLPPAPVASALRDRGTALGAPVPEGSSNCRSAAHAAAQAGAHQARALRVADDQLCHDDGADVID